MRDLVAPTTLAWEREGDLEAQVKEQQSWRVFCARRRGDTREDSQEEAAQNEGVRVASGGQPHGPDRDGVSASTLPAGGGQGEDEDERQKNWMRREKIQKEPREVERLPCFKGNAGEPRGVNATSAARGGEKEERSHA